MRTDDLRQVQSHLDSCPECARRWQAFEWTVRMVRTLPQATPDPSFVGQVLDRVRAYEAEAGLAASESLWERALRKLGGLSFGVRGIREWVSRLAPPVPIQLAGALTAGVFAGFLIADAGLLTGRLSPSSLALKSESSPVSSQVAASAVGVGGELRGSRPARPFADLARELAATKAGGVTDSTNREEDSFFSRGLSPVNPQGQGRQVLLRAQDGRSPVTFF